MITLSFNQETDFDTSQIPERWIDRVQVQKIGTQTKVSIKIDVEDSSYRYRALMQRPQLVLKFSLPYFIEFPVGTTCVFQNQTYTLNDPENLKKQGTRNIEYSMTLGTAEDNLSLYKLRNSVDGRLKWSMCAKPHEFIEEIVKSLNDRDGGIWQFNKSHIIEATEKTIEFNHAYCDEALASVAETFETEYEIIDNYNGTFEIALHKVEYFKDSPLPLSYGRGNGFVPGLGRSTESDGAPIKRLYVQGGERNIDRSKYGDLFGYSGKPGDLRLPKSQIISHEERQYKSDAEGFYIERYDKTTTATKEDSLDCSEIYPSYKGHATKVETINQEKNFYDIIDTGIPPSLNFNDYVMEGENMTLIFQTGMLAGKEFEVKYKHDERRWELVPIEQDGVTYPNETFKPSHANGGDEYAVFGIMLPKEYICDNTNKTGAAWEMFKEAARYLYDHEDQKFTFEGDLQTLYAKRNWLKIGGYLKTGAYIHFTDNQFAKEGADIRIIGVKDFVNDPYAPKLTISNAVQSPTTASSQLKQIENTDVTIDETKKSLIQFTKRRFRDAKETLTMLEDLMGKLGDNFTDSITPITVQTMSLLVGDESLQFEFGTLSGNTWTQRTGLLNYDNSTKVMKCNMTYGGAKVYLRHLTIGQDSITSESGREKATYLTWPMKTYESPTLAEPNKKYYLYAKVSRTNTSAEGVFSLEERAKSMEEEAGYYYLLCGILNSEYDGERSFVTLYGFTEILPGRITTDRIVTGSGDSFLDLVANAFKLGDKLSFNINGDGELRLKGTLVQSPSGDESPLPSFRGEYNASVLYFRGDVVTYKSGETTSSYMCITTNSNGIKGIEPTNTTHWKIYAEGGSVGVKGDFKSRVFARTNTRPSKAPTGGTYDSPVPTSTNPTWSDGIPDGSEILWSSVCTFYGAGGSSGWSIPAQETDTDTLDIEFCSQEEQPTAPKGDIPFANHESETPAWYDPSSKNFATAGKMIWRAERKVKNGVYEGEWVITRIYGEKGDKGNAGNFYEIRYNKSTDPYIYPGLFVSMRDISAYGYKTEMPEIEPGDYVWMTKALISGQTNGLLENWSIPLRITGEKGAPGLNGTDAPIMVYRGEYDPAKIYYGNPARVDCVKSGATYYIALTNAIDGISGFSGKGVTDTKYWKSFGGNFESIATGLLLAENATIGNWFISGDNIASTHGTINGTPSDNYTNANFRPDVVLDGKTGEILLYNDRYPRVRVSNQSVATLFNESAVEKNNISQTYTKPLSPYHPPGDATYNCAIGELGTINLGNLTGGSGITISNFSVSLKAPAYKTKSNQLQTQINGTDLVINIKKDGVTVHTLRGGSGSSASQGNNLSVAMGANGYSIPENAGGTYSLEIRLEKIQFISTSNDGTGYEGYLDDVNVNASVQGFFTIGGFNRTVIGNDGIGSFWGSSIMVFTRNQFITKNGDIGFKVDAGGVYKTTNAMNANPTWNPL